MRLYIAIALQSILYFAKKQSIVKATLSENENTPRLSLSKSQLPTPRLHEADAHSFAAASNGVERSGYYAVTDFRCVPHPSAGEKDTISAMICPDCRAVFE